jgi:hypothetical protein
VDTSSNYCERVEEYLAAYTHMIQQLETDYLQIKKITIERESSGVQRLQIAYLASMMNYT